MNLIGIMFYLSSQSDCNFFIARQPRRSKFLVLMGIYFFIQKIIIVPRTLQSTSAQNMLVN